MNSEIKTYRFILTPTGSFFFGGEKSPFKEEYFQKSRLFPQQTTILGFLRYQVLQRAGLIGGQRDTWEAFIGRGSFNASPDQTFGLIKSISPVSVYNEFNQIEYFPLRNSKTFNLRNADSIRYNFGEDKRVRQGLAYFKLTSGENLYYDHKEPSHLSDILFHPDDLSAPRLSLISDTNPKISDQSKSEIFAEQHGVFYSDIRPGITKDYFGLPRDEGYFKIQNYRMLPKFSFSFHAEIQDCGEITNWMTDHALVTFGGDHSVYRLRIEASQMPVYPNEGNCFVLLSDAAVDNALYDHCSIAVTQTVSFRNLKTSNFDDRYTKRPVLQWFQEKGVQERNTEPARVLLKRGSILLARDGTANEIEAALSNPAFKKIGYNHFCRFNQIPSGL